MSVVFFLFYFCGDVFSIFLFLPDRCVSFQHQHTQVLSDVWFPFHFLFLFLVFWWTNRLFLIFRYLVVLLMMMVRFHLQKSYFYTLFSLYFPNMWMTNDIRVVVSLDLYTTLDVVNHWLISFFFFFSSSFWFFFSYADNESFFSLSGWFLKKFTVRWSSSRKVPPGLGDKRFSKWQLTVQYVEPER